jgi:hypothetical protein
MAIVAIWAALVAVGCDQSSSQLLTSRDSTTTSQPTSAGGDPAVAPISTNHRKADQSDADKTVDISFEDLKFEIEAGEFFERSMLPDSIESLVGQTVRIRGFMLPTMQRKGIKQFVLIRDNQECCFGPGAEVYHCVQIEMTGEASAQFVTKPVAATGTLGIEPFVGPDGRHWAIYHMKTTSVD